MIVLIPMFSLVFGSIFMMLLRLYGSRHQQSTRDHVTGLFNRYMLEQESEFYLQDYQCNDRAFHHFHRPGPFQGSQ
ncbi:MAG: hypothetical protein R3E89_19500 [Thiolinea sp.]